MSTLESEVHRSSHSNELERLFPGKSELAQLMRSLDWSKTDLASPLEWSEECRVAVKLCLSSGIPIVIYWGPQYTVLYNDSYISFLNDSKHPFYLGKPAAECWAEIWDVMEPMLSSVYSTGQATWSKDVQMFFSRRLPLEEVYIRFTFGPILAADGVTVQGVFCPCTETTEQCIRGRRLETLDKLSILVDRTCTAMSVSQKCAEVLAQNPYDISFATLYLVDEAGNTAVLNASAGLNNLNSFPSSVLIDEAHKQLPNNLPELKDHLESFFWPISAVLRNQKEEHISDLCSLGLKLPGGHWPEFTSQAILLPLLGNTEERAAGVLILGISPRCVFDDSYRSFFDLVARHIGITITEAKAYEAERQRAEALIKLDQAKTRFFSNISHEFRTPLTLILGSIEDALGDSPSLQEENFKIVYRNSLHLLKLVNNLLDFSRVEANRMQAHFEPYDIALFTTELASNFRSAIEKVGLQFKVDCSSVTENIYIDPDMWEKIVLNLLSNAFKFTLEGEIEVKLLDLNNSTVALIIRDTGTGIASHDLAYIFNRFHRIEGARGRTHEGSSIGLALVQDLVRLHKGEVQVLSELDKGTTFTVLLQKGFKHLPQDQVTKKRAHVSLNKKNLFIAEAMRWYIPESVQFKQPKNSVSNARILIADDNTDMREYLARLLSGQWIVETVSNGELALKKIRSRMNDTAQESPYDLILMDGMMPELDGLQLLDILKADLSTNRIPVIMLSARASEEARIEGLQKGADDYLSKPFSARELITRVQTLLELTSQRRGLVHELNTMNHLHSIATRFVQEAEVSGIFLEIIDSAMFITNADKGSILLADEQTQNLKITASRGFDTPFLDYFASCPPGEGACGTAFQNHERVIIYDITEDPRFIGTPYLEQLLAKEIHAVQATPLKSRTGKVLGILATYYKSPYTL